MQNPFVAVATDEVPSLHLLCHESARSTPLPPPQLSPFTPNFKYKPSLDPVWMQLADAQALREFCANHVRFDIDWTQFGSGIKDIFGASANVEMWPIVVHVDPKKETLTYLGFATEAIGGKYFPLSAQLMPPSPTPPPSRRGSVRSSSGVG
ncbi:MAG: hypothetical protein V4481_00165 [Patescibacteria group bacterium]